MNNKNTTIAGVGAILVAAGSVLTAMFDGDPTTNAAVAAVIAGIGLIMAKDAANKDKVPPTNPPAA